MTADAEYSAKLRFADQAVAGIFSGASVAMAMAAAQPPALLAALAKRVEAGALDELKLWYFHSVEHAAATLLRRDLLDRVRPHCMFLSAIERDLIRWGDANGRQPIEFVPVAFSDSPRLLAERVNAGIKWGQPPV